jgi:hypothetical protein
VWAGVVGYALQVVGAAAELSGCSPDVFQTARVTFFMNYTVN